MGKNSGFNIEVTSKFSEFWRYNILITCGCFDENDERVDFISVDGELAPVGSNYERRPSDFPSKHIVKFDAAAYHHLLIYIYVIPHSIPVNVSIEDGEPFDLDVCVRYDGSVVGKRNLLVNNWSGASFELQVDSDNIMIK